MFFMHSIKVHCTVAVRQYHKTMQKHREAYETSCETYASMHIFSHWKNSLFHCMFTVPTSFVFRYYLKLTLFDTTFQNKENEKQVSKHHSQSDVDRGVFMLVNNEVMDA